MDNIENIKDILKFCDDIDTKLKFYNYIIDELHEYNYYNFIERADLHTKKIMYRHALRDYRLAINVKEEITHGFGEISYAYHKMSEIYYKMEDYSKALECAEKAVKVHPGGWIHVDYDDDYAPDIALEYSENMAKSDLAEMFYKIGDYNKALSAIKTIKKDYMLTSDAILLSKILIARKNYLRARIIIEAKVKDKIDQLMLKAQIAKAKGNKDSAFQYYKEAEQREEFGWEYHLNDVYNALGKYYESENNIEKALEYYLKEKAYSRNCIPAGDLYFKTTQYDKALTCYLEQLSDKWNFDRNETEAELYFKIGQVKDELNDKDAIRYYRLAYYANKNNPKHKEMYDYINKNDDSISKRELRLSSLYDDDRKREIKYIVRNILDDWLEHDEIDEKSDEYIRQLLSCSYPHDITGGKVAAGIIKEFLGHIDSLYVGDSASELKNELLELL